MSSFVGLYTGLSGIPASQTGIDVASHNVANANTPGDTRQRVELHAAPSYGSPVGRLGTGVDVSQLARLRDGFLDDRFRTAVGDLGADAVRAETLASLESLAGEPDHGVSIRLARLWDAAEIWANDPADNASRRQVLTELESVSESFRTTSASWDRLGEDLTLRRDTVSDTANATPRTLHDLDRRMANADPTRIGPELHDQRDQLLDQLAALTGATARVGPDGRANVQLGGTDLLTPAGPATLSASATGIVVTGPDGVTADVTAATRGELGGLHGVLTVDLPAWRSQLDDLATAIVGAVNGMNTDGGGPPLLGFDDAAGPARSIRAVTQDTAALAASTAGPGAPPHDGSNARRFADLRTTPVDLPGGSRTIGVELADLVTALAGEVRSSRASAQAAGGVATGATLARAAEHGVGLDEEMVGLVRYRRALEATTPMRITSEVMVTRSLDRVQTCLRAYERTLATDRRIISPSDAPAGSRRAMTLRATLHAHDRNLANISDATGWLESTDSNLRRASDRMIRVRELANAGASATSRADRVAIADEIEQIAQEIAGSANARHPDRPLLGGYASGAAVEKVDGVWRSEGDGDAITRRVSESELVRINVTASEWLGFGDGEDLLTQLDGLVGDLRDGTSQDVNARLDELRAASNRIGDAMSRIGATTNRVDSARARAESQALTVRTELSNVQDVDIAEGVMELQIQQVAYEATLQALAKALPPSLVSFLR